MRLRLLVVTLTGLTALGAESAIAQNASRQDVARHPAANTDITTPDNKIKLSYAIGYDLASGLRRQQMDVDAATLIRGISDGLAKKPPEVPPAQMEALLTAMQQKFLTQAKAAYQKAITENKARSEQFLAQYRSKSGVKTLSGGIMYRVIDDGGGVMPTVNSQVRISFRGALVNGKVFASTLKGDNQQPITVGVSDSPLRGLTQVLTMMKQGAHWEVVLPSDQAYGDSPRSPVGPGQAVVFDITLVEVLK
jgi:FKBP-type peptidyl-prolyl cis-trans isomerase